jgi:hypothetical protein
LLPLNIRRISVQPVVRRAAAAAVANGPNGGAGAGAAVPAALSPSPARTLYYLLWDDEYEQGIDGRKAARLVSRGERAKHK